MLETPRVRLVITVPRRSGIGPETNGIVTEGFGGNGSDGRIQNSRTEWNVARNADSVGANVGVRLGKVRIVTFTVTIQIRLYG